MLQDFATAFTKSSVGNPRILKTNLTFVLIKQCGGRPQDRQVNIFGITTLQFVLTQRGKSTPDLYGVLNVRRAICLVLIILTVTPLVAQRDVIRARVDLVVVPASVRDGDGKLVFDLAREDFQIA